MTNKITQALEQGAGKLAKTLGEDTGKSVKNFYHETGTRLKRDADDHVQNDTKIAGDLGDIAKGGDHDLPHSPHAESSGGHDGGSSSPDDRPPGARDQLGDQHPNDSTRPPESVQSGGSDPVDMASGRMFLPQSDIILPGTLPLAFTRRVESGYRVGRWFGPSWSSTADERLELDEQGVVLVTEDGLLLSYPHPDPGGDAVLPTNGPRRPLTRTARGDWAVEDPDTGRTRHFADSTHDPDVAPLDEITDRNGNWIAFDRDPATGAPTAIRHHAGYRLTLTTEDGRITALHAQGQEIRRYGYTDGNLTSVTDSCGGVLRLTYDERARVTSWTDSNDRRYEYHYDAQDRCVAESGEAGHLALRFGYDETDPGTGHRVTTVTDADGHTHRYVINRRRQVVAETDALGHTTLTPHDESDRLTAVIDPLGRTTAFEYDDQDRLTGVARPDGLRATATYDRHGLPAVLTDPDGSVWRQEHDDRGNRAALVDPTGAVTRYEHDDHGRPVRVTNALGQTSEVRCDEAGLPLTLTDALGAVTRYERDVFGRVVAMTDPCGDTTRLTRDAEGRVTTRVDPDGSRQEWVHDGEGNCVTYTDAMGGRTTFEYGHFDMLSARTTPDGVRYEFTHDAHLRLTRVTNPAGLTWDYAYDPLGRLTTERDFDGRTLTYTHDAAGQLITRTDEMGQVVRLTYDVLGNVVEKDASGLATTYAYDSACRLTRAANAEAVLEYTRNGTGKLLAETHNDRTLRFTYDLLGRRTGRTTPSGATTAWEYDAAGQTARMTTNGREFRFTRDAAGRETARSFGADCEITQSWDPAGRLSAQQLTGPGGRVLQRREFAYRTDGHLVGIEDSAQGRRGYRLDAMGRVTAVTAQDWEETYAYDVTVNQSQAQWPDRFPQAEARGERQYAGTRITASGNTRYEHDALGRMTLRQRKRLSRPPETWTFAWDAEDHLTQVTTPDGETWRYAYDPLGRRIAKRRLGSDGQVAEEVSFVWDGSTLAEQTTTRGSDPVVSIAWDYNGLQPVAQTEHKAYASPAAGSADAPASQAVPAGALREDGLPQEEVDRRFFAIVTDLVGTPTELIDESGEVSWRARSTLWGITAWTQESTAYTPLRFPGQYFDAESGLHYNFHRYYDPGTGRYLSPDPLGLSPAPNPLSYVDNPHRWSDPLGLAPYRDLYHGTTKTGAEAIVKNGVDPSFSKRNMDFGKGGFYTTESRTQAEEWAKNIAGRSSGAEPAVLHYRVSQEDLDKLNNKKFDGPSTELDDFLRNSRTGGPMHHYDTVEGPMLRNLKGFLKDGKPSKLTGHQIALYTPEAASLFNSGLQGIL